MRTKKTTRNAGGCRVRGLGFFTDENRASDEKTAEFPYSFGTNTIIYDTLHPVPVNSDRRKERIK